MICFPKQHPIRIGKLDEGSWKKIGLVELIKLKSVSGKN